MPDKTVNYELTKPFPSEFYDVTVQNGNMDKIDAGIKANADAISALEEEQSSKADLGEDGKVLPEQMPNMNYDPAGAAENKINMHNIDENAHPYLVGQIATCITVAQEAKDAANVALETVSELIYTIDVVPTQNGALIYSGQEIGRAHV